MVQKILIRLFTLLLIFIACFCPVSRGWAEIPPEKVVRTGYTVPDAYLTHPEDMVKTGYTYDYLQMIASYNHWRYEYVYGSWSEQLKKLETGEIDALSNVSKTPEREKKYLFPDYPLRIEIYYIYAPKEKASLYDEIGDLRGRTVAVGKSTITGQMLKDFDEEHHLGLHIVEYGSMDARLDAMRRGEVDVSLEFTSRADVQDGFVPLFFVGNDSSYIAVTKGREDLLKDLNRALIEIQTYNPTFVNDLRMKYFTYDKGSVFLPLDNKGWFRKHGPVRMGYMAHMGPYIWKDSDGKARGTLRDLLDAGFKAFDISEGIEYIPYESMQEMRADLVAGKIDAAMPVYDRPFQSEKEGLLQTNDLLPVKMYKVSRENGPVTDETVFAVADSFPPQEKYVKDFYPHNKIIHYPDLEAALQAVRNHEADAAIMNPYLISIYVSHDKILKQEELPNREGLTILVNRDNYPLFLAINRMENLWGESELHESLMRYADELYQPTFMEYVERNYGKVLVVIFVGTLAVTFLVSLIIFRGRQKRAAEALARVDLLTGLPNRRAYEEKLREIEQEPPPHLMAAVLDLNGLKKANDTRGHRAGDELIRAVGDCFRKTCDDAAYQGYTCLGYRVGGDEFAALLYMDEKTCEAFKESFQKNVSQWKGKRNDSLSLSLGYAGWDEFPDAPVTELLRVADNRMYEDKERYYRGTASVHPEHD